MTCKPEAVNGFQQVHEGKDMPIRWMASADGLDLY